jgi:hypothetical protein
LAFRQEANFAMTEDDDERAAQQWYDRKTGMMVDILGEEHGMVMHAMIPYAVRPLVVDAVQ